MTTRTGALDESELIDALEGVHLLGIRSKTAGDGQGGGERAGPARRSAPTASARTRSTCAAAAAHGVAAFNAPFSNTRSVVEIALADIIALTRRLTVLRPRDARRHLGEVGRGRPRGPRPDARHHRLRQHRHPALGARREPRHVRRVLRHGREAGAGQRPPDGLARRAARRPPTSSPCTSTAAAGTPACSAPTQFARMRPGRDLPQPVPRVRRRLRRAARRDPVRPRRRRRGRRLPGRAQAPGRRVRVGAARPAQRHPHAAHRRVDGGGAGGDRPVRVEQAPRLPRAPAPRR